MAEGALEVEMSTGMSGEGERAAQLDGPLELHVDGGHELELPEGVVPGSEGDGMVTEPVLGIRMLMSSRVSAPASTEQAAAWTPPYVAGSAVCVCTVCSKGPRWRHFACRLALVVRKSLVHVVSVCICIASETSAYHDEINQRLIWWYKCI